MNNIKSQNEGFIMARKRSSNGSTTSLTIDVDTVRSALSNMTGGAKDAVDSIIADSIKDFKIDSDKIQKQTTKYIAKQPLKSVGIALAIGVVVGYLMHNK
jgi:ElaB/YqjD/DUF883 family membrane-anchored ribosome-binding protein